jgi:ribosomal protein L34
LQLQRSGLVGEGIADLRQKKDSLWLTVMGSFAPTEAKSGFLLRMDTRTGQGLVVADRLQRPVSTAFGDLNGDGAEDAVICEFGRYTGQLAWWSGGSGDTLQRHTLLRRPGATKAQLRDLDHDGDLDIAALFGQADEGIWLFFNDGKGHFTSQNALRFGPANGSGSFEFCDFNTDGHPDILYACGDNADFKPVRKPWHGVYIFLNDGRNNFKQHYFYHLPGAYQALARDFDLDGDLDIAAVAFFPDFEKQAEGGFVLLQQDKKRRFRAFTFPESVEGRWMVMDAGDPDGDGDLDLVLGSMTFEVPGRPDLVQEWKTRGLPFVVLKNTALR